MLFAALYPCVNFKWPTHTLAIKKSFFIILLAALPAWGTYSFRGLQVKIYSSTSSKGLNITMIIFRKYVRVFEDQPSFTSSPFKRWK